MYQTIYVPVDNSDHSNRAITTSIAIGKAFDSKLVGSHVYAARMHDYRFKQMEFTLPEEYLEEGELSRQRKIHDSLITMGLEMISDCYLTDMDKQCQAEGLPFQKKMMDGKHSTEILKDIDESKYDLVVIGALGIGRTRDAQLGSVCQRVSREVSRDMWVVKHLPKKDEAERDTIMIGVDGSPESFGALQTGLDLAKRFGKKVDLISVYDPYLHYSVFKGIVNVLTDQAAKVFRFEEQNQLHEEIIDTGLAEIYQSHLNVAEKIAQDVGVEVTKTLMDGKCFQKVLDHARKVEPWVLIIGRIGIHREDDENGLGSNTDNLLRLAPCDILLTTSLHTPELDIQAEESIHWTPEAEARIARAPAQVKGIARTGILRLAIEKGHSVVTSDLVTEAMDRFMPGYTRRQTEKLAEALALEKARDGAVSVCKQCSNVALVANPVRCTQCGGTEFGKVTKEIVEGIEAQEGGADEETTYDGRKLRWTRESRKALKVLTDSYQRRRAKARIEKAARSQKMEVVSVEMAQRFIEEEGGVLYNVAESSVAETDIAEPTPVAAGFAETVESAEEAALAEASDEATSAAQAVAPQSSAPRSSAPESSAPQSAAEIAGEEDGMKLLARDRGGAPFLSRRDYDEKALERILRVPKGFMRDRTQGRIEELAAEEGASNVTLELVEAGIEMGLEQMKEMITGYNANLEPKPPRAVVEAEMEKQKADSAVARLKAVAAQEVAVAQEVAAKQATAKPPVEAEPALVCPRAAERAKAEAEAAKAQAAAEAAKAEAAPAVCPRAAERAKAEAEAAKGNEHRSVLNEVSVMSELDKKRQGYLDADT